MNTAIAVVPSNSIGVSPKRVITATQPNTDACLAAADQFIALVRLMKRNPDRLASLTPIVWDPATCPNCDAELLRSKALFCGDLCSQEASFVRYARAALADGRYSTAGVRRNGFGTRLIMLANGGYPTQARTVASAVREEVRRRDNDRCQLCGDLGTAIDHIDGNDSTAANLQLLCRDCNTRKMASGVIIITSESHPQVFAFIERQRKRLSARTASAVPLRICDEHVSWRTEWRSHQRCAIQARLN